MKIDYLEHPEDYLGYECIANVRVYVSENIIFYMCNGCIYVACNLLVDLNFCVWRSLGSSTNYQLDGGDIV